MREIAEELRLEVEASALLDTWVYAITPEVRVLIVTYGCSEMRELEAVMSHEHEQLAWFPLAQVSGLRMPEGYKASIRAWAAMLGSRRLAKTAAEESGERELTRSRRGIESRESD